MKYNIKQNKRACSTFNGCNQLQICNGLINLKPTIAHLEYTCLSDDEAAFCCQNAPHFVKPETVQRWEKMKKYFSFFCKMNFFISFIETIYIFYSHENLELIIKRIEPSVILTLTYNKK